MTAGHLERTISRVGTTEDISLQISKNEIEGHSYTRAFGANHDVGTSFETVWPLGGTYSFPAAAATMTISSGDANDTSAGSGAQTVLVTGLDTNYNEISETLSLNGQTPVTSTNLFLRVNGYQVQSAGVTGWNEGIVYVGTGTVTAGVPANSYSAIAIGENISQQAVFTVPADVHGFLLQVYGGVDSGKSVEIEVQVRPEGEVFRTIYEYEETSFGSYKFAGPIELLAKTDVDLRAKAAAANTEVDAGFELLRITEQAQ